MVTQFGGLLQQAIRVAKFHAFARERGRRLARQQGAALAELQSTLPMFSQPPQR